MGTVLIMKSYIFLSLCYLFSTVLQSAEFHSLLIAVRDNNTREIRKALKAGADINGLTRKGFAPIHRAAILGNYEALRELINLDADIFARSFEGATILHLIARANHAEILSKLLKSGLFVNYINAIDDHGRTALHYAVSQDSYESVLVLLVHRARVNKLDNLNLAPLHLAARHDSARTARLLLQYDANPDIQTVMNNSPLHLAAYNNSADVARILLEFDASVNKQNWYANTPLHIASERNYLKIIEILIYYNASFVSKDFYGKTPVDYANLKTAETMHDMRMKITRK